MKFMYITNRPEVAVIAEQNGVDWVFVDMETLGKEERQGHMDSVKSHHTVADVRAVRSALHRAELLVRVNPVHENSPAEIDAVIEAGADWIMLPMWKTAEEVCRFLSLVRGRCRTMLLLETREAELCLDEVVKLAGVDAVHIGLNDLHLSYGKTFLFEMLADGTVERICQTLKAAGIPYGFGGVGRLGQGTLPAEHILSEHVRLGSEMVILSRSFCNAEKETSLTRVAELFSAGVAALREQESVYRMAPQETLEENRKMLCSEVAQIVEQMEGRK